MANLQKQQQQQQPAIIDLVEGRLTEMVSQGAIEFPKNYSYQNALKEAWLYLQTVETKDKQKALDACTRTSIANALMEMTIKGLSVAKKQCYFIPYGPNLTLQESYFGRLAMVKRVIDVKSIAANVIYQGDTFEYTIDPEDGKKKILRHDQSLEDVDENKIVGVYAIMIESNGNRHVDIMSMTQVRKSWGMGRAGTKTHDSFTEEMSKRTVLNRLAKTIINTSDDGHLEISDEEPRAAESLPQSMEITIENEEKKERSKPSKPKIESAPTESVQEQAPVNHTVKAPFLS